MTALELLAMLLLVAAASPLAFFAGWCCCSTITARSNYIGWDANVTVSGVVAATCSNGNCGTTFNTSFVVPLDVTSPTNWLLSASLGTNWCNVFNGNSYNVEVLLNCFGGSASTPIQLEFRIGSSASGSVRYYVDLPLDEDLTRTFHKSEFTKRIPFSFNNYCNFDAIDFSVTLTP